MVSDRSTPSIRALDTNRGVSIGWTGKQNKISIWIQNNEVSGAPRFFPEDLVKGHSGGLETQKELLNLVCSVDGDRGGEQMFTLPYIADEHRLANQPQSELCIVTYDLSVERRVAINKVDSETELSREELTLRFDIGDEQLR